MSVADATVAWVKINGLIASTYLQYKGLHSRKILQCRTSVKKRLQAGLFPHPRSSPVLDLWKIKEMNE
jgi:hypothetical protein